MNILAINKHGKLEKEALGKPIAPYTKPLEAINFFFSMIRNLKLEFLVPIIVIMGISALHGCKEDCGEITCTGISSELLAWMPYENQNVIQFINEFGQEFTFTKYQLKFDKTRVIDCGKRSLMRGCDNCYEDASGELTCPYNQASFDAVSTDQSRFHDLIGKPDHVFRSFGIRLDEDIGLPDTSKLISMYWYILDLEHEFFINQNGDIILDSSSSFESQISLNGRSFQDVVVFEADTSIPASNPIYETNFVWKFYIAKELGLVGFHDAKTKSLFRLK